MSWVHKLLGLCFHEWETIAEVKLTTDGRETGRAYVLRCKKCGEITRREV